MFLFVSGVLDVGPSFFYRFFFFLKSRNI